METLKTIAIWISMATIAFIFTQLVPIGRALRQVISS